MKKFRKLAAAAAVALFGFVGLGCPAAFADIVSFTWNPSGSTPTMSTAGSFTANNITIQDFAAIYFTPTGPNTLSFTEQAILPLVAFSEGGSSTTTPGLNGSAGATAYGIFAALTATGNVTCLGGSLASCGGTFTTANYTLYGNPGDHSVAGFSSTTGDPTYTNIGTAFALATGSLVNCGAPSPTCQNSTTNTGYVPNAAVTTSFNQAPGESGFFVAPPATVTLQLFASTINNATEFSCYGIAADCGFFYAGSLPSGAPSGSVILFQIGKTVSQTINPGGGSVNLVAVPEPSSLALFGSALICLVVFRESRRRRKLSTNS